jgi:radical SAM protein with 4Fe4S-binding SPASM domain
MSPELNGLTAPRYQNFRAGNIHGRSLAQIITAAGQLSYVQEYATGLARCARECSFYDFCRGGNASNRHAEHGRFDTTETAHCRNSIQAPVTAALDAIRKDRHMAEITQPTPTEDILARLAGDVGREPLDRPGDVQGLRRRPAQQRIRQVTYGGAPEIHPT